MSIHSVNSLCPICYAVSPEGVVDMTGQDSKYVCPLCGGRHYGEPEVDSMGGYCCARCNEATPQAEWKVSKLAPDEVVNGSVKGCSKCIAKLGEKKVAFIEIEDGHTGIADEGRTGRVFFFEPPEELKKALGEERSAFITKSVLEKYREPDGQG